MPLNVLLLENMHPDFSKYNYLDRGSDERQCCVPGIDLPVASVMRTQYGQSPKYYYLLDNLDLISMQRLKGAYEVLTRCIKVLENNEKLGYSTM